MNGFRPLGPKRLAPTGLALTLPEYLFLALKLLVVRKLIQAAG
jgi:hypothetical protein